MHDTVTDADASRSVLSPSRYAVLVSLNEYEPFVYRLASDGHVNVSSNVSVLSTPMFSSNENRGSVRSTESSPIRFSANDTPAVAVWSALPAADTVAVFSVAEPSATDWL